MAENTAVNWKTRFLRQVTSAKNGGRYKVMTSVQCQKIVYKVVETQNNPSSKSSNQYRKPKRFQMLDAACLKKSIAKSDGENFTYFDSAEELFDATNVLYNSKCRNSNGCRLLTDASKRFS